MTDFIFQLVHTQKTKDFQRNTESPLFKKKVVIHPFISMK